MNESFETGKLEVRRLSVGFHITGNWANLFLSGNQNITPGCPIYVCVIFKLEEILTLHTNMPLVNKLKKALTFLHPHMVSAGCILIVALFLRGKTQDNSVLVSTGNVFEQITKLN